MDRTTSRSRPRRSRLRLIVAGTLLIAATIGVWITVSPDIGGPKFTTGAVVSWNRGGDPLVVTGRVIDSQQSPLPNRFVRVMNSSGNNFGTTDAAGRFRIETAEEDLCELEVEGLGTVKWEWVPLSVRKGVNFEVQAR